MSQPVFDVQLPGEVTQEALPAIAEAAKELVAAVTMGLDQDDARLEEMLADRSWTGYLAALSCVGAADTDVGGVLSIVAHLLVTLSEQTARAQGGGRVQAASNFNFIVQAAAITAEQTFSELPDDSAGFERGTLQ